MNSKKEELRIRKISVDGLEKVTGGSYQESWTCPECGGHNVGYDHGEICMDCGCEPWRLGIDPYK